MQRIAVVGSPGSGKTTLARELARRLRLGHVEIDALFHQPGWEPLPDDQLAHRISAATAGDRWVTDGNYRQVAKPIVWSRADTVVFLDLPRRAVMWALLKRSVGRGLRREVLWNGNRERLSSLLKPRKEDNILLWTWTQFDHYRESYRADQHDPTWDHLIFVRLQDREEIETWLNTL